MKLTVYELSNSSALFEKITQCIVKTLVIKRLHVVINDVKLYDVTKAEGIKMQPPLQCSLSVSQKSCQVQMKLQVRTAC